MEFLNQRACVPGKSRSTNTTENPSRCTSSNACLAVEARNIACCGSVLAGFFEHVWIVIDNQNHKRLSV